jgi:ubiquinone biosynthesis monooxygenase Coq7
MLEDEERHGHKALEAGGKDFPGSVKDAMSTVSRVMTESSYRV